MCDCVWVCGCLKKGCVGGQMCAPVCYGVYAGVYCAGWGSLSKQSGCLGG